MPYPKKPILTTIAVLATVLLAASAADARRGRGRGGDDLDDWDDHRGRGRHGHHDGRFDDHRHDRHGGQWDRHRHGGHHGWWLSFEGPGVEIESHVVAVEHGERLLILETGEALHVPLDTPFHPEGDVLHFDRLAAAVERGWLVEVEGFVAPTSGGVLLARALKAEIDD